jgi:glycosyltransferase involved in cell wall biosynthesis
VWRVIQRLKSEITVVIWVHGAEIQPWWRRAFNFTAEDELELARRQSDERMSFWREVFLEAPENLTFVFVSEYLARTAFEDVGVSLPVDRYRVIPNPIDVELFGYTPKPPAQRLRILSIRPFASRVYANDLTVEAILLLKDQPWFRELEFRIIGDGPLYEETVAPIQGLPNVVLERRFLTQHEIASIHKEYGVFLVPSRMDTQGVSRDEAMSSGLVPITTSVAAIPEFVDGASGFLVPPDDSRAIADAIAHLREHPEIFSQLSRGAAERVRRQSAMSIVSSEECRLFLDPDVPRGAKTAGGGGE